MASRLTKRGLMQCLLLVLAGGKEYIPTGFSDCHDDLLPDPGDSQDVSMRFVWLAFLQYLRIKDGQLYHGLVPRVVMVHRQYVLTTARNVAILPEGYSLGNIVFPEYDRDEHECGVSMLEVRAGAECNPTELLMPIDDVLVHPEFVNFGAPDSVALLKMAQPIDSQYMTPVCLPYVDVVEKKQGRGEIFLVDFLNKHPLTLNNEIKYSKKLHILPSDMCGQFQKYKNISESWWSRSLCTSGCGMEAGAPIVSHQTNNWWIVVGLTSRSAPCPLRGAWRTHSQSPPLFVYVWPYIDWIARAVAASGRRSGDNTYPTDITFHPKLLDDPFGYQFLRNSDSWRTGWVGRVYRVGDACWSTAHKLFHYYQDRFRINSDVGGDISIFLNVQPEIKYTVACVKVTMPNRFVLPKVWGVYFWNFTVDVLGVRYKKTYEISIDVTAYTTSEASETRWMEEKTKKEQNKEG